MPKGILCCPKCYQPGMDTYDFYEYAILNDGKEHWSFYYEQKQERKCRCWALWEDCGYKVHHPLDPCDCCFNPCDHTPDIVTYENGIEVNRQKDCFCGMLCCLVFICVAYLIYCLYFTIFIWYDLYVSCCKRRKRVKVFCAGEKEEKISEDESFWTNNNTKLYTEAYWCNNYPNLFKCSKCSYQAKSFKEFLDKNQISENPVEIANTQNDVTNGGINYETQ